jgi:hypothetical protein
MIKAVSFILLSLIFTITETTAATYIVAESGGNFTSIQEALNAAYAGDTVLVREKSEPYYEAIRFIRSGNENEGYIVLAAYPNERPVIDGTGVNFGSDWIIGLVKIVNKNYVEINGFEIRNLITSASNKFPAGIWVRGSSNHIRILNNKIHGIKHLNADAGAHGLAVYGTDSETPIHDVLIENNEIYDCVLAWSESLVLNGNVENFIVRRNIVHDNDNIAFDFIGYEGTCSNSEFDMARNGLVSENVAYNIDSRTNPAYGGEWGADGFYVDGGKDIVFERNLVYNCNIGFEFASEHAGKFTSGIIMRNNFVLNNHAYGLTVGGYDAQRGGTKDCIIVNNTFYCNRADDFDWATEININYYCENFTVKNNIFYSRENETLVGYENTTCENIAFDYNSYFSEGSPEWIWRGESYSSFEQFRNATGGDGNSLYSNPMFDTSALENFSPVVADASPVKDAGINLPSEIIGEYDFCGETRVVNGTPDIGAYEIGNAIGVNDERFAPNEFRLSQNYPNPFNPTTTISYSIPTPSLIAGNLAMAGTQSVVKVALTVYNSLGRKIATLVNKAQPPGNYTVQFNAENLSSGIYFYSLATNGKTITKKMIFLK